MAVVRIRDKNGKVVPLRVIKGDPGNQMYVRFSAYADGTDMSETWDAERNYLGIAFAYETPTDKADYQWVSLADISLGRYAEEGSSDRYLFFVGNGTDENNRSNAMTLDDEGEMWVSKDILLGDKRISLLGVANRTTSLEASRLSLEERTTSLEERTTPLEERTDVLEVLADKLEGRAERWNVDSNVGSISSAVALESKVEEYDILNTDNRSGSILLKETMDIEGEEKAFSFPCINSGKIYIDHKNAISVLLCLGAYAGAKSCARSWKTVVGVYVNDHLVTEYVENYKTDDADVDAESILGGIYRVEDNIYRESTDWIRGAYATVESGHRTLLDVKLGDVVKITSKIITTVYEGTRVYPVEYSTLSTNDIRLKANIATMSKYLNFGEELENPTYAYVE